MCTVDSYWQVVDALKRDVLPLVGADERAFAEALEQEPVMLAAEALDAAADAGVSVALDLLADVERVLLPDADGYDAAMLVGALKRLRQLAAA